LPGKRSGGEAVPIEYDGEGGRNYIFVVYNKDAWNWV
jgi:hypothetical protein